MTRSFARMKYVNRKVFIPLIYDFYLQTSNTETNFSRIDELPIAIKYRETLLKLL